MRNANPFAVLVVLGGLVACTGSQGPKGDPGPAGEQGPAGPQGPAGEQGPAATPVPAAVWLDANDTLVGPGVVLENGAPYFDARGLLWTLDMVTGQFDVETMTVNYDAPDCMGNAYVGTTLSRRVFQVEGDSAGTFRLMPDNLTPVMVRAQSARYGTSCSNFISDSPMVPLADTLPATPIVKPTVTFVGPLHLALR